MSRSLDSSVKWLSNDNLKLIEIINSDKNNIIYKEVVTNNKVLQSDNRDNFMKYYNPITLDTLLYNGIPRCYRGPINDNSKFNSDKNIM
tara:strand:- start:1626 stop:1892 length:267 start_codon:yes stop_codon:yes gene_type:complete